MSTELSTLPVAHAAPNSLSIMLNPGLFEAATGAAKMLAKAEGFMPRHLLGKTEACFAVVLQAHDWKLSPLAVARCTYQTPSGQVGYEGKLIHAVLEASGELVNGVSYEHVGDWSKVQGKFEIRKGNSGKDYAAATWGRKDAEGLSVIVRAKLRREVEPRSFQFDLVQAFPLNSTLWATDPKTQLCYLACRRFASLAVPHLVMGVPFDQTDEDLQYLGPDKAKDVTPANDRAAERRAAMQNLETIEVADAYGAVSNIMPGELGYWLHEQIGPATTAEQLGEMIEANATHPAVVEVLTEALNNRKPKASPAEARRLYREAKAAIEAGDHAAAVRARMEAAEHMEADPKIERAFDELLEDGKAEALREMAPTADEAA